MIVDNFLTILPLLDFSSDTEHISYIVQVLKRRKDKGNEEMETGSKVIRTRFINSDSQLVDLMPEIIFDCERNNARAYISINGKSQRSIAIKLMKTLFQMIIDGEDRYKFYQLLESCSGQVGAAKGKESLWIVDVDFKDLELVKKMKTRIHELRLKYSKDKELKTTFHVIPTLNGYHIISSPFNSQEFCSEFSNIDIHKNAETLLYYKSLC